MACGACVVVLLGGNKLLGRCLVFAEIDTGGNDGLNSGRFLVVRSVVVVVVALVVARDVLASGFLLVVTAADGLCVAAGAFDLCGGPLNGGLLTLNNGLLFRLEFSVVVVIGSWLSLSTPSSAALGSSVNNVVSRSSGSGVVTV